MIAVLFLSWILLSSEAAKECYWANGQSLETTNTIGYVPCYPNAVVSHCCLRGEACLDNGLCFGAPYGIVCLLVFFNSANTPHIFKMLISTLTALPRCLHRPFLACGFGMRRSYILLKIYNVGRPIHMRQRFLLVRHRATVYSRLFSLRIFIMATRRGDRGCKPNPG
jgi:hypothetical protein